jgi:hypothetical protein
VLTALEVARVGLHHRCSRGTRAARSPARPALEADARPCAASERARRHCDHRAARDRSPAARPGLTSRRAPTVRTARAPTDSIRENGRTGRTIFLGHSPLALRPSPLGTFTPLVSSFHFFSLARCSSTNRARGCEPVAGVLAPARLDGDR